MSILGIGLKIRKIFNSGKAVGKEFKVTEATNFLQEHAKGIGEEIGNHLSGKAKEVNEFVTSFGGYDAAMTKLNEIAKQYPNAVVKVAGKESKGYTIARATVKNGDKTLLDSAVSLSKKDDLIKTRTIKPNASTRTYIDLSTGSVHAEADNKLRSLVVDGHENGNLAFNVYNEGENVAQGNIHLNRAVNDFKPTSFSAERADNLTYVTSKSPALDASIIVDTEKAPKLAKQMVVETKENVISLFKKLFGKSAEKVETACKAEKVEKTMCKPPKTAAKECKPKTREKEMCKPSETATNECKPETATNECKPETKECKPATNECKAEPAETAVSPNEVSPNKVSPN